MGLASEANLYPMSRDGIDHGAETFNRRKLEKDSKDEEGSSIFFLFVIISYAHQRDQVIFFLKRTRQVNLRVKTGVTSDGNLAHFK